MSFSLDQRADTPPHNNQRNNGNNSNFAGAGEFRNLAAINNNNGSAN